MPVTEGIPKRLYARRASRRAPLPDPKLFSINFLCFLLKMPFRYKTKKKKTSIYSKKRRVYRKLPRVIKRRIAAMPVARPLKGPFSSYGRHDPFKPYYSARLHYSDDISLSAPATVYQFGTDYIFRLNSLYDPNETSTGHQPYGFDQLAALYRNYKVNAVLINVQFYDPSADGTVVAMELIPPGGTGTLAGKEVGFIRERPMAIVRTLNNTGSQRVNIKQYVPISTVSGVTPLQFKSNQEDFQALVGANPVKMPRLQLAACSPDGTAKTVRARVSFVFYCTFFERVIQSVS